MTHVNANKKTDQKDPVCGMDVSSETCHIQSTLEDHTYYFCAEACKEKFEKSPQTYLKPSSFFLKRWWNNYLKRLNKVTDGKPKCCD